MAPPNASLSLMRSLLREAAKMDNYNFRLYALRRVRIGFQNNRHLTGNEAEHAYLEGKEQLDILKRQAVLGHLYPTARSVMETA